MIAGVACHSERSEASPRELLTFIELPGVFQLLSKRRLIHAIFAI
jgi:hypothetical protein